VPVYLLVTDSQTDENIHSIQICEFTYIESPTPSPLKRYREEPRNSDHLRDGSPVKRPNSQPLHPNTSSMYHGMPSSSSLSSAMPGSSYSGHSRQSSHQNHREMPIPVPYQAPSSLGYDSSRSNRLTLHGRDYADSHYLPTPLAIPELGQTRYIAEPQDHYGGPPRSHDEYSEAPSSASRMHHRSPGSTPTYYQPSIGSSPATWKSPYHSASALPYEPLIPEDAFDPAAPTLQRTSTLSSGPSSGGARNATPSSTPATWLPSSKAKLEIMGDLDDMAQNWSPEEFGCRRRLVQFWRKQEGNVLRVNFRPVSPGVARPLSAVVISCIYWEERQECFFTSVDAIFLLESLVGNKFAVEEKNRIRRNLEGFRPFTVSKGKSDSENFFKLIMGFPAPKPRNIEKDVKAFPWRILTNALRKIISKYSASYEGLKELTTGESVADDRNSPPGPSSTEMPPPSLLRQSTTESDAGNLGSSAKDVQVSQQQQQQHQPPPPSIPSSSSAPAQSLPQPNQSLAATSIGSGGSGGGGNSLNLARPRLASPPRGPLSIQVPQLADNLPMLDGAVPSNTQFERRSSGISGFPPLTGLSTVDFSEFFNNSPNAQPGTASGWPTSSAGSNAFFPPPSAGFGLDSQPPRKD
jgi:hypothetical protein